MQEPLVIAPYLIDRLTNVGPCLNLVPSVTKDINLHEGLQSTPSYPIPLRHSKKLSDKREYRSIGKVLF
jgi:hypothetical protein